MTNSSYTYDYFYNLASEFNGSSTDGCSTNASTCRPLVQYFGVWNEPNGLNNYNDTYYDPGNLGNYLNDFANQFLIPAYNGVKSGNPGAYVMAGDIATVSSSSCGGWNIQNCYWNSSWMVPLNQYYSAYFDVISQHGYNQEGTDKTFMNNTVTSYDVGFKQVWMTETAYASPTDLTQIYVDQHNNAPSWGPIFYSLGNDLTKACGGADTLLCSNDGVTYARTAFFSAYQAAYAPH